MSKMSKLSAEMDNKGIPVEQRNSLIERVSEGMHAAEKQIDSKTPAKKVAVVEKTTGSTKVNIVDENEITTVKKIRAFADRTHNVITLDGKSYVKAGVYQYLAHLLKIVPTFDCEPESTQEEVWCTCTLYKDGLELSHAVMYADKKEVFLRDKPDYAVLGMAQTRAFVRAMKNLFGYLIELAGYQSVGAEEVIGDKKNKE